MYDLFDRVNRIVCRFNSSLHPSTILTGLTLLCDRALRVWNSETQSYDAIDPAMTGAPAVEDRERYWNENLLPRLAAKLGDEFIATCSSLNLNTEDFKIKYISKE